MHDGLEIIPIFFAVDNQYIPFLAVTLQSLIDNSSKRYYYSIKILHINVSNEKKKMILKYQRENVNIEFVDLNYYIEKIKNQLYTRDYYTKTTYFRLFMPDLYPQYNKALYLDSDIVVLGDIAELYHQNIGTNLVAAVPDDSVQNIVEFQEYVEKVIGVSSYNNYFNAGILLMNLDELRKFKFQEKFLYLLANVKYAVAQDQDYLNRLCKGRVYLVDNSWNRMPLPNNKNKIKEEDINLIHYNLIYKPWHSDNVLYKDYFWNYAKKTEFYKEILKIKENYTEEERFNDMEILKNLKALCIKEADCVGDDRKLKWFRFSKEERASTNEIEKSRERLEIIDKINNLEKEGRFDEDVENDPPTIVLDPEDVDYLRKKSYSKIKTKVANKMGEKFLNDILKDNKLIIKNINGLENIQELDEGAIITCNHFNPFDSFAIEKAFRVSGQAQNKKLYKVIREGNYTNFPGLYGFFFRNCDTLPLSSNKKTMIEFLKAVDIILQRGDYILIYPEQSMWWNYKKPKPLKNGAFKLAARNDVPVVPIFITMEDSSIMGEDGFPVQEYTINVGKPIFPNEELSQRENMQNMKQENERVWKEVYENFYKIPLEYTCDQNNNI